MMKMFSLLILPVIFLSGCIKKGSATPACSPVTKTAPASEVATLQAYLDSNHIAATQDSRGFFYNIDSSASTVSGHPTICSDVRVISTGTFLNGVVFDSSGVATPYSFGLSSVITGWQEAVPLMKLNSTIVLYVPPSLAYGPNNYQTIPGNSNLIFYIRLLAFN